VVGEAGLGLGPRRTKAESANPRSCLWGREERKREKARGLTDDWGVDDGGGGGLVWLGKQTTTPAARLREANGLAAHVDGPSSREVT
jgi:hypothetical protein